MKKITLFLALFLCGGAVVAQNKVGGVTVFGKKVNPESISPDGYIRCASTEYEEYLRDQNPKMETTAQFESWISKKIKEQKAGNATFSTGAGGVIYIPVVVHVIHNGDAYGVNENITDEQVQSQITVMTQDFRRMVGTPGFNSDAVGADTKIEFVLAKVDANGNPTNGIDRLNLCKASWSTAEINALLKPTTIWNPSDYMNMWSVNFTDPGLLGYAQFPESNLGGMSLAAQNANTDGVVAGYKFFGSAALAAGTTVAPYDGGRTMTHEVGHFLGLRHIWGDNTACPAANTALDKDFVADTPAAAAPNYNCPAGTDSCPANPGVDMIANYMDYTDDACMNIFTVGQAARVATVMANSPRRASLATSQKDQPIALFANDAQVVLDGGTCVTLTCAAPNPAIPLKTVLLYNRGTSNLTSATLTYNFTGAATYTYNWVGSLATNKFVSISLPNTSQYGTLNVSVSTANGGTDQRATNNASTKTYNTIPYYNFTTYNFNLVGDRYGTETTWDLKNAAGAILYSGGPYTDLPAKGTQNLVTNQVWNLPANSCYYLTVRDSYGDGIMPGSGSGYFTVTANGGAVSVINNTYFDGHNQAATDAPISTVHYFTNNANLESDSFNLLESVTLYPNPSKDFFTIDVPQSVLRAGKLEVYNNLGQKVLVKTISSDSDLNVNVSGLNRGVYFLNLNLEDSTKTLKFIKE